MNVQKLERELILEQVNDLRKNPYELAHSLIRDKSLNDSNAMQLIERCIREYTNQCKRNAYIMGDTYRGMPIERAIEIIAEAGFIQMVDDKMDVFRHKRMRTIIVIKPNQSDPNRIEEIVGEFCIKIDESSDINSFGLGLYKTTMADGVFSSMICLTGGLKVKTYIIESFASA